MSGAPAFAAWKVPRANPDDEVLPGRCTGVIAGVVSFMLAHGVKWVLDKASDRTNGAFGYCTPSAAAADPNTHGLSENPDDYKSGQKPSLPTMPNEDSAKVGAHVPTITHSPVLALLFFRAAS